uniref:Putative secreted protein n=1 Tax=Anopheles darlingi TaxID=43151 RepID=A0A2M4D3H9_ANODA
MVGVVVVVVERGMRLLVVGVVEIRVVGVVEAAEVLVNPEAAVSVLPVLVVVVERLLHRQHLAGRPEVVVEMVLREPVEVPEHRPVPVALEHPVVAMVVVESSSEAAEYPSERLAVVAAVEHPSVAVAEEAESHLEHRNPTELAVAVALPVVAVRQKPDSLGVEVVPSTVVASSDVLPSWQDASTEEPEHRRTADGDDQRAIVGSERPVNAQRPIRAVRPWNPS